MGLRTPPSRSYDGSVPMSSTSQRGHSMARKNDDNFYRRQQDESNRLAATQNRHLNEIAKLAKSSVEEMRKMRRAFETFTEAMLGMKIEPFQGAVLSEAARGQIAEFDIKGFKETLLKGEALTVPGGESGPTTPYTIAKGPAPEGSPYPHVDISTPSQKDRVAEHVKDARAAKLEAKRATAREDEERARREGKARTGYGDVLAIVDEAPAGTVEAAIQEAIDNGEHPPALDGLDVIDDSDLPACGFCGDNVGLPECPAHGEVLPPGVTPKMMADHPEFAERVRRTPHYHQANQYASGGYTGVGLGENVVGGIVHQGIFSDATIPEKNARALSQYAADAERQRRDGLASY